MLSSPTRWSCWAVAVFCSLLIPVYDTATVSHDSNQLLCGAWNIQIFGVTKMSKPEVPSVLVEVLQRYDVVLIQEIRDASQTAIYELLSLLNAETNQAFNITLSSRLGRTSSKEQYAYLFRHDRLKLLQAHVTEDAYDKYQREPYKARFASLSNPSFVFDLYGLHSQPSSAVPEVSTLVETVDNETQLWGATPSILYGDFNADCSYVSAHQLDCCISLWSDERFAWLINSTIDTTIHDTDCAYDRIVVTRTMLKHVVPGSARVYRFDLVHNLTQEESLLVSDHYPVELLLDEGVEYTLSDHLDPDIVSGSPSLHFARGWRKVVLLILLAYIASISHLSYDVSKYSIA